MSSFTTPLKLEFVGGNRWRLTEPFEYHVGSKESEDAVLVPAGFETDFASIPQIFWNILPPTGDYGKAAVIHDYLYATQGLDGKYTRKRCDQILLEGMVVLGVGGLARWIIYNAVRWFGGWAWDKKDK